jgi:hypothetical protein
MAKLMAGPMPSVTAICIAAMFSVPRGSVPRKLMNKPVKLILSNLGIMRKEIDRLNC